MRSLRIGLKAILLSGLMQGAVGLVGSYTTRFALYRASFASPMTFISCVVVTVGLICPQIAHAKTNRDSVKRAITLRYESLYWAKEIDHYEYSRICASFVAGGPVGVATYLENLATVISINLGVNVAEDQIWQMLKGEPSVVNEKALYIGISTYEHWTEEGGGIIPVYRKPEPNTHQLYVAVGRTPTPAAPLPLPDQPVAGDPNGVQIGIWYVDGPRYVTPPVPQTTKLSPTRWHIAGAADFNGDGKSDILWRDTDGAIGIWLMDGVRPTAPSMPPGSSLNPNRWHIASFGDFNGDGKSDILWRDTDGAIGIWLMDGVRISNPQMPEGSRLEPSRWQIKGVGDFNGDRKSDILWRDITGQIGIWIMDGVNHSAPRMPEGSQLDPLRWHIAGVGRFDSDNKSDILWRDVDGSLGIWLMDGGKRTVAQMPADSRLNPNRWHVFGVDDFDGDGRADILWR